MQELSQKCQNKSCQDERIAAVDDAATAEEHHSQEIELLKKELSLTKRKLGQVEEDLELPHRDNDKLRKVDLGLFYPKMDYMDLQMPGQPDDISIGQHLSENSEVILLCTYFDLSIISLQIKIVRAGLYIVTTEYSGILHRATKVPTLSSTMSGYTMQNIMVLRAM